MIQGQQLQLVNFKQAQILKKAGFDWECNDVYWDDGELCEDYGLVKLNFNDEDSDGDCISAPTVALALKWFRDVKKHGSFVKTNYEKRVRVSYGTVNNPVYCYTEEYNTYELAESALLDELLTLIEKQ